MWSVAQPAVLCGHLGSSECRTVRQCEPGTQPSEHRLGANAAHTGFPAGVLRKPFPVPASRLCPAPLPQDTHWALRSPVHAPRLLASHGSRRHMAFVGGCHCPDATPWGWGQRPGPAPQSLSFQLSSLQCLEGQLSAPSLIQSHQGTVAEVHSGCAAPSTGLSPDRGSAGSFRHCGQCWLVLFGRWQCQGFDAHATLRKCRAIDKQPLKRVDVRHGPDPRPSSVCPVRPSPLQPPPGASPCPVALGLAARGGKCPLPTSQVRDLLPRLSEQMDK